MTEQLVRLKDWRKRLAVITTEIKDRPFEWGIHDCGPGLAGRIVEALTGKDLAADYRGRYSDAVSAARLIRDAGFSSLGEMIGSILPAFHPSKAQIGDIAAIPVEGPIGHGLGVVIGERILVLTMNGTGTVDLLDAQMIFKVG